jgi:hypothetical protein
VHTVASPEETPPFDPPPSARWKIVQGMANQLGKARIGCHQVELDVEGPLCPEDQGVFQVPAEALRAGKVLQPNEETVGRWDYVRRTVLKEAGVEPGAPRLGPAVLAYQDGVPQGAATTMYSDVRYNLFRYLGTKADPHPVRVMEFSKVAELGPLLTTVTPRPSAVLVVSRDPDEGYLAAKAAVPGAAVQSMSAATLASRPVHGDEEGDPSYFNPWSGRPVAHHGPWTPPWTSTRSLASASWDGPQAKVVGQNGGWWWPSTPVQGVASSLEVWRTWTGAGSRERDPGRR